MAAALALGVVGEAPAVAGPGDYFGPAKLRVRGAASSQEEGAGMYGLGVWAQTSGAPEEADGQFRFGHRGPDGEYGVAGNVHCLTRDAAGLIQVSGRVFGSGGENFAGKDFAATVDVDGSPQRFSDARFGEPGTLTACGGGEPTFHTVTDGGYEASEEE
ncbi:MAG: hypothetical protein ACRDZ3_15825 [Acidimicrobiia bacterium]